MSLFLNWHLIVGLSTTFELFFYLCLLQPFSLLMIVKPSVIKCNSSSFYKDVMVELVKTDRCTTETFSYFDVKHTSSFKLNSVFSGDTAGSCGDPGIPSHGSREQTDFRIRSKVYFTCSEGYELIGSSERMCFPNGTWSGMQPSCRRRAILQHEPFLILEPWQWPSFRSATAVSTGGLKLIEMHKTLCLLYSCPVWKPWNSQ